MLNRARRTVTTLLVLALAGPAAFADGNWTVDPSHTTISFSVDHFFTPVTGSFNDYQVDLDYDAENPENSSVEARIQVASVDTGNDRRDNHLRTADFFEVETYPEMTFKSTSVKQISDTELVATGPLTIKGTSQDVELKITHLGTKELPTELQQAMGGSQKVASFTASTSIDRGDFGVGVGNFAATLVVGGTVDIEILVETHYK
jgi:polyisoprenoid-binding protein YceI